MTDATCFLVPPEPDAPFDHSRKVVCRALVPVGRPRIALTRELAEKICDLVAGGNTFRKIGDIEGMPSRATIRRWIAEREDFRRAYALEGLVEDILEEINEIADDATIDYGLEEGADGTPVVREKKETIARASLRIATKFKLIAKMAPHKYGDVPPHIGTPCTRAAARWRAGAKVIDGEVIPIEQHPLYDSVEAWRKVAKEAK
jgi:hypothetical protein